jgi:hypothetical protein
MENNIEILSFQLYRKQHWNLPTILKEIAKWGNDNGDVLTIIKSRNGQ